MSSKWINDADAIVFEKGKDPGDGKLRIVGDLEKIQTIGDKRSVSFREVHEVIFGKGTSTLIKQYSRETSKGVKEEQLRIAGLTKHGRPLVVVLTTRDNGYEKRVITA